MINNELLIRKLKRELSQALSREEKAYNSYILAKALSDAAQARLKFETQLASSQTSSLKELA